MSGTRANSLLGQDGDSAASVPFVPIFKLPLAPARATHFIIGPDRRFASTDARTRVSRTRLILSRPLCVLLFSVKFLRKRFFYYFWKLNRDLYVDKVCRVELQRV